MKKAILIVVIALPLGLSYWAISQFREGATPPAWLAAVIKPTESTLNSEANGAPSPEELEPAETGFFQNQIRKVMSMAVELRDRIFGVSKLQASVDELNALTARFERGEITETEYFARRRDHFTRNPNASATVEPPQNSSASPENAPPGTAVASAGAPPPTPSAATRPPDRQVAKEDPLAEVPNRP
jgi:hypothetical protein